MNTIRIAAALLVRPDGQTLLVRKRGASAFMQPGGKIGPGETPDAALARELKEEIDLDVAPASFEVLGEFHAEAANEPGHRVHADVFLVRTEQVHFHPAAEIEEVKWASPLDTGGLALAPLTADHIFPHYREMVGRSSS
ncbi:MULTISPECIES: NUDIX domain-containing protein [unclassified Sinorhizobium]|uniref:NUDIX hydrolase n=1 Tax=unclassified Sinorhizobium TaxID=2613772 RepID=UPI0024C39F17|nr:MULTISPECIES: NUDIX domain-containing protein [unclassified Sinorhizobium]MDK1378558.1 NUDIX domain-containing protein [Sinorhizobium sp. 6-70]MDK1482915.1 NUDIX domain-containing protein [Sinorhizobium sp. 6-117]